MHDIASKRYRGAATSLFVVDGHTAELAQKQLIASIAKLAAVADYKSSSSGNHKLVSRLDDELKNIDLQRGLAEDLSSVGDAADFVHDHANLADRPALARILETGVETLLRGDALDTEDLVDVWTLKNPGERVSDGALAVERLWREVDELPRGRLDVALKSAWRRIYIRDDWADLANTAGRSEEDLRAGMRETWAYATFKALYGTRELSHA